MNIKESIGNDFHQKLNRKSKSNKGVDCSSSEYVFAFEDEVARTAAKGALRFVSYQDSSAEFRSDPVDTLNFDQQPVFVYSSHDQMDNDSFTPDKYRTIFTYSDFPVSDKLLVYSESPVRTGASSARTGITALIYMLSGLLLVLLFPILCWIFIKWIPENERLIVFRLGRRRLKGPGLVLLLPFCDKACSVRLGEQKIENGSVSGGTKDEALVEVRFSLTFRLTDLEYVCTNEKDAPSTLLSKEAQVCLLSSLSRLSWANLDTRQIAEELRSSTTTSLNFRFGSFGLQVDKVDILDLHLVRSPPSPNTLQKQRMSVVQKQLQTLSSAFFVKTNTESVLKQPSVVENQAPLNAQENPVSENSDDAKLSSMKPKCEATPTSTVSSSESRSCKEACLHAIRRARPLLKHDLVCKALQQKRMQLVVSSTKPTAPSTATINENEECCLFYLDAKAGFSDLGRLPGSEPPDVTLYISARDLLAAIHGRLDVMQAVQQNSIFVVGDEAVFNKLRHLLHF